MHLQGKLRPAIHAPQRQFAHPRCQPISTTGGPCVATFSVNSSGARSLERERSRQTPDTAADKSSFTRKGPAQRLIVGCARKLHDMSFAFPALGTNVSRTATGWNQCHSKSFLLPGSRLGRVGTTELADLLRTARLQIRTAKARSIGVGAFRQIWRGVLLFQPREPKLLPPQQRLLRSGGRRDRLWLCAAV